MTELLWAALAAGLTAFATRLAGKWIDRDNEHLTQGKSLRDELREDIERLEGRLKETETKISHLEAEVETWKGKVDEWRNKYFTLYEENQLLRIAASAKDQTIAQLKEILAQFERKVFLPKESE